MVGLKEKEFKAIEVFIDHLKRVLGTKQQIPMKLKHKSSGLIIEFKIDRVDGE
jgi:hypothetical protein